MTDRALLAHAQKAQRAQAEFGLCDACLGRRFAKVETGLTNPERARVFGLPSVPVERCWLCEGLLGELDVFADVAVEALAPYEHRHFLIGTRIDPAMELREAELNAALATGETAERTQSELNRETGKRVAARTGKPVEFKQPDITVIVDTRFLDAELQFGALYVFGRYQKLSREMPQTTWPCNRCGGRRCAQCGMTGLQYPTSVQLMVAGPFLEATGATQQSFHGAGREDIDARCIGEGRPFVLEINDPRARSVDLAPMAERVKRYSHGEVEVLGLRFTTKAEVAHVKEHGGSKTYRARVRFDAPVAPAALAAAADALRGAGVRQRTPRRVEHRRADLVRERRVLDLAVEEHEGDVATLRVHGDAGLYIKELVSGDEGRTEPSLAALLGVPAKVTELDIIDVEYEPPKAA
ncbi:MAG TPA: tRNA pseudouridine(54/55) synthase Pus10 [Candidatus Thermoplasmatota archaeon]|nr:tRNA pseudouridine(54/55) synthase Pus10 [Candidatus Thermoplasmatota archaeon]